MQAINHATTALLLKKKFPSAPLFGLILATEAVEYLWVGLNLLGVERTIIDPGMRSVADVHLVHMPFSHSITTTALISLSAGLIMFWRNDKAASAAATGISLAIASHLLLDLVVHAPDIAIAPFIAGEKLGSGLYANLPLPALVLESLWGVFCWWIYRGSRKLLALIAVLGIASIPLYSVAINVGEAALAGQSTIFALVILVQMLSTSWLVWKFAKEDTSVSAPEAVTA
ncbi:MAG: hypothetical protein R3256_03925 [Thalassovita sp.]|nr:hypothetical protein [Thalassovita sp.]